MSRTVIQSVPDLVGNGTRRQCCSLPKNLVKKRRTHQPRSSVARCFLPYLRMESNAYNAHSWRALCYPMPRASERHKWLLGIYSLCSSGSASLLIITSEATLSAYLIEGIAPSAQSVHRASFAYRSHYRHTCMHPGGCRTIGQCDHWILALRPWTGTPGSQTPAQ